MKTVNNIIEFHVQQAMINSMVYDSPYILDNEKVRKQFYNIIPDNAYRMKVSLKEVE